MVNAHLQDCLLTCLSYQPLNAEMRAGLQLDAATWEQLVQVAQQQRVAPLLHQRIKDHALADLVPDQVLAKLHRINRGNAMRNIKLYQALAQLLETFQMHDIPTVVLKGAYLAQAVYPNLSLRFMVDGDVVVPKEHLATAAELAASLDYQSLQPIQASTTQTVFHHLPRFVKKNSVESVEIHRTIIPPNPC